jgi:hypothetical protein
MLEPPFRVTEDAAAWILERVQSPPHASGGEALAPVVGACLDDQMLDRHGRVVERHAGLSFVVDWNPARDLADLEYPQIEILGHKLSVEPHTLDMLRGKELYLETVEVGYPNPKSAIRTVLRYR